MAKHKKSMSGTQKSTIVSADASSFGLGAVFLQEQDNKENKPVAYASRSMTSIEQRYAQIEKEVLATTWVCEKFNDYLLGKDILIETDHKPLVPLFGSKTLVELPPRIQRFQMRLMKYSFKILHVPGKELVTADTLSKAPLDKQLSKRWTSQWRLKLVRFTHLGELSSKREKTRWVKSPPTEWWSMQKTIWILYPRLAK